MFASDVEWSNWMGNLRAVVNRYRPEDEGQLSEAVLRAVAAGKVRTVGASSSWSPLVPPRACGGGTIISVDAMRTITSVDATSPTPSLSAQAGASIRSLVKCAKEHGIALITPTIFQEISLGGAIAVGAHGTGLEWATMSDAVESLKIVTPDGVARTVTPADGDMFDAMLVGLGCFGVIHEVKLRCERAFRVQVEDLLVPRGEVLSAVDDLLATYDFVELYWFPFNETMWVKGMSRTDSELPRSKWRHRVAEESNYWLTMLGTRMLPWMANWAPRLTPSFMKLGAFIEMTPGCKVGCSSEAFHYQRAYRECWDMSWAVPIEDAATTWRGTMALIERFAASGRYPVNMCVHSRFIGASRAWMAPSYGYPVCDIEVVTIKGTPEADRFYRAWTELLLENPNARPHWGKHLLSPERIGARYPRLKEFLQLRDALDPSRAFTNEFLERRVFQEAS